MSVSHDLYCVVTVLCELSDGVKHLLRRRVRLQALQERLVQVVTCCKHTQLNIIVLKVNDVV